MTFLTLAGHGHIINSVGRSMVHGMAWRLGSRAVSALPITIVIGAVAIIALAWGISRFRNAH